MSLQYNGGPQNAESIFQRTTSPGVTLVIISLEWPSHNEKPTLYKPWTKTCEKTTYHQAVRVDKVGKNAVAIQSSSHH